MTTPRDTKTPMTADEARTEVAALTAQIHKVADSDLLTSGYLTFHLELMTLRAIPHKYNNEYLAERIKDVADAMYEEHRMLLNIVLLTKMHTDLYTKGVRGYAIDYIKSLHTKAAERLKTAGDRMALLLQSLQEDFK